MTAPTVTAGTTTPYPLTPGAAPTRITDGTNNAPAGLQLVNRGDSGGTIWIMSGPAGQSGAVPLGPGASMQWTDTTALPYAYVIAGATAPETLVVTSQSTGYQNPTVVAAAAAAQMISQGLPAQIGQATAGQVNAAGVPDMFRGATLVDAGNYPTLGMAIDVSQWHSLVVSPTWYDGINGGTGPCRLLLTWSLSGSYQVVQSLCMDAAYGVPCATTWIVPVIAPTLTISSSGTIVNYLNVYGTNRTVDKIRMLGEDTGGRQLVAAVPAGSTAAVPFTATNSNEAQLTRFQGSIQLLVQARDAGTLRPHWVTPGAGRMYPSLAVAAGNQLISWNHPVSPVYWDWVPASAPASSYNLYMAITQS